MQITFMVQSTVATDNDNFDLLGDFAVMWKNIIYVLLLGFQKKRKRAFFYSRRLVLMNHVYIPTTGTIVEAASVIIIEFTN